MPLHRPRRSTMRHSKINVHHKCAMHAPPHNRKWRIDVASQVTDGDQLNAWGRQSPMPCSGSSAFCCTSADRGFIDMRASSPLLRPCTNARLPGSRVKHLKPGAWLMRNQATNGLGKWDGNGTSSLAWDGSCVACGRARSDAEPGAAVASAKRSRSGSRA